MAGSHNIMIGSKTGLFRPYLNPSSRTWSNSIGGGQSGTITLNVTSTQWPAIYRPTPTNVVWSVTGGLAATWGAYQVGATSGGFNVVAEIAGRSYTATGHCDFDLGGIRRRLNISLVYTYIDNT